MSVIWGKSNEAARWGIIQKAIGVSPPITGLHGMGKCTLLQPHASAPPSAQKAVHSVTAGMGGKV